MSFNDYLEHKLLNHVFSKTAYPVTNTYVALFIGNPGEDGSGGAEVSDNGYTRVDATGKWSVSTGVSPGVTNVAEIVFPEATPSGWGEVDYFAIFDAVSGGNMLASGALTVARDLTAGSIPRFDATTLRVFLD